MNTRGTALRRTVVPALAATAIVAGTVIAVGAPSQAAPGLSSRTCGGVFDICPTDAPPVLSSMSPKSGQAGTIVTVTGTALDGPKGDCSKTKVFVLLTSKKTLALARAKVTSCSATQLTFAMPENKKSTKFGTVLVKTRGGVYHQDPKQYTFHYTLA